MQEAKDDPNFDPRRSEHETGKDGKFVKKKSYILTILSHAYTSPDAPVVNNPDDEIPQRFINGCDGDLIEARHHESRKEKNIHLYIVQVKLQLTSVEHL
jgi:hypothetical protein